MVLKITDKDHLDKALNADEEIQLASYVDQECSTFASILVKRKLQKSFEARQYVDQLERSSQDFKKSFTNYSDTISKDVNLADRVYQRIVQEERLSLLRSLPSNYEQEKPFFGRYAWGAMGAVCASLVLVVFPALFSFIDNQKIHSAQKINSAHLLTSQSESTQAELDRTQLAQLQFENGDLGRVVNYTADELAARNSEQNLLGQGSKVYLLGERELMALQSLSQRSLAQQGLIGSDSADDSLNYASLAGNRIEPTYRDEFGTRRREVAPKVVDVDWVRSSGRVRVLRDPQGRASILWVQKKQPSVARYPKNQQNISSPAAVLVSGK
jgi:hypothetical protein